MNPNAAAKRKIVKTVKTLLDRKFLLASFLGVLTLGVVACTNETIGQPTAGNNPTSTGRPTIPGGGANTSKPTNTSKANPDSSPIRNTDPCTLLTATETAQIGVGQGKRDDTSTGTSRGCEFVASGRFNLRVLAFDVLGTKDVQATSEVKPVPPVGNHQAVQATFGTACAISLAVTETSRVDAVVSAHGDTQQGCQIAMQVAQLVEPKLPV